MLLVGKNDTVHLEYVSFFSIHIAAYMCFRCLCKLRAQ